MNNFFNDTSKLKKPIQATKRKFYTDDSFPIKGLYYRSSEVISLAKSLHKGNELCFVREHYNSQDKYSVRVESTTGVHFGYVPFEYSKKIFTDLEGGVIYKVVVNDVVYPKDDIPEVWVKVERIADEGAEAKLLEKKREAQEKFKDLDIPIKTEINGQKVTLISREIEEDRAGLGYYKVHDEYEYENKSRSYSTYNYSPLDKHMPRLYKAQEMEAMGMIDDAIKEYEELADLCFSYVPFERLCIIFRKRKMFDDEIRVIESWLQYEKEYYKEWRAKKGVEQVSLRLAKAIAKKEKNN